MREETPAVQVAGLTHHFGQRRAVSSVSFRTEPGSIVALLGPNGGGKTTLFRILATLLSPSQGDASILGLSVVTDAPSARALLGVVFQNPSLDLKLTVSENLRCHGHLYGIGGRELSRRCADALAVFGIEDRARDRVEILSGGQRRRVELAKILIHRPPVLLLDEPSSGLDPSARADLFDHLERLRREHGTTVLLTTHYTEEAERCDRVGIMDQGALVAFEEPGLLKKRIGGDVLVVQGRKLDDLEARIRERFDATTILVDGTLRIEALGGHRLLGDVIETFREEITAVSWGHPTLGDVFVHLTGRQFGDGGP